MPFLAPALPFIIPAAAQIGSSVIGSKLAGGAQTTPLQNQVFKQQLAAGQLGMDTARQLLPQGQGLIGQATQAYNPVLNYWSSLLSGNRGLATSALAPEISRIGQGYQTAAQTSAALNPRGGPSATFLSELPFQQQRDISTLFQQIRPQAASQLFNVGQGIGQLGLGTLGQGVSSLYGATAAGRDIINQQQQAAALAAQRGQAIGKGIFDLVQQIPFDKIFKTGGGGPFNLPIGLPTVPGAGGDVFGAG